MRRYAKRILQKIGALSPAQLRDSLAASAREVDRLETVLDSLPRGILVCDTAHRLVLANKAARKFLSLVSYEQGGETVWSVIPDELIAEFLAATLLSADKAEEKEFDVEVNGAARVLGITVTPLVQDGQVSGSLVLAVDITERKGREAQLRRMESLAGLTTLAAGVAHEIKNPLGSLSIHVQLIQKILDAEKGAADRADGFFPRVEKYLSVVNEEVERLNRIVVDFLFAVRPMNADLRFGNINALIGELAEFVSFELKEAGVECALSLAADLPLVKFDGGLMKQALLNLIKNAEAAMPDGGELSIATEVRDGAVSIAVADTGTGIPEANLAKIFEPYFTTKETGSGLGLTRVFKIVKEHQGDINVKSREGKGSVFIIALPIPQTERRLIAYEAPETPAPREARGIP